MDCGRIIFSKHAFMRIFERQIDMSVISSIIKSGTIIESYPDDAPFPSFLVLGFNNGNPLHVVVAHDKAADSCIVVTVYEPEPNLWSDSFNKRKK